MLRPALKRLRSDHKEPEERWLLALALMCGLAAAAFGIGWFADGLLAALLG